MMSDRFKEREGEMQRALSALTVFVLLCVSAVGGVVPTVEARVILNGSYAFTTFRSCTVLNGTQFLLDSSGAPTIIPAGAGVFRQNAVDSGVITFNVDGTGTSVGRSKTMNISALPSSTTPSGSIMSISEFKVPFTYAIDADNTVDISFGVVHFDVVDGGGTGNSGTVSARNAQVQIGNGA